MKNFKDYLLSINLFCEVLIFRTSGSLMFFKIGVIKNFTIFTEKFCWSLSLITLYAQTCNFIKKSLTQVFSCGIYDIFKKTYFEEHLQTIGSETCSFTCTALFDNLQCWLNLAHILQFLYVCQFSFHYRVRSLVN